MREAFVRKAEQPALLTGKKPKKRLHAILLTWGKIMRPRGERPDRFGTFPAKEVYMFLTEMS